MLDRLMRMFSIGRLHLKAKVGRGVIVTGHIWLHGEGSLVLGDRVVLDARSAPIELKVARDAKLQIGDDTYVGGGTSIEVEEAVTIGDGCRMGPFVKIIDNNFHNTTGDRLGRPASVPIVVEEGATIGARAILLPGSHVGKGARIAAATVLTRRVPKGGTATGVPAAVRGPVPSISPPAPGKVPS